MRIQPPGEGSELGTHVMHIKNTNIPVIHISALHLDTKIDTL